MKNLMNRILWGAW